MIEILQIKNPLKLLLAICACQLAGIIGSFFTFSAIPTWYATLAKPSFSPPNWLFGPVWITLYTLMGIALYLVLEANVSKKLAETKRVALAIFAVQLVLNALWSIVFFGAREILYALVIIALLWLAIVGSIVYFYRISKTAVYLLVPYLLWVSFASVLNYSLLLLN